MCQRQSSSPILPSAAEIPPWAATVCERVGNTFVRQAVWSPARLQPTTARSPAPPAPTTTTSYVWSSIGYARPFTLVVAALPPLPSPLAIELHSERDFQNREGRGQPDRDREERIDDQQHEFRKLAVCVILDDDLHADLHVIDGREDEEQHQDRDPGRAENLHRGRVIAANQRDHEHDEEDRQRHARERREALMPEMPRAGPGGAEPANL